MPLTSHLRAGMRPVVRGEWRPERCADTAEFRRIPAAESTLSPHGGRHVHGGAVDDDRCPPERIYQQVANFYNWRNWSPWEGLDPDLRRVYFTKIMGFVKSMDAAPLTHPPHRDDRAVGRPGRHPDVPVGEVGDGYSLTWPCARSEAPQS